MNKNARENLEGGVTGGEHAKNLARIDTYSRNVLRCYIYIYKYVNYVFLYIYKGFWRREVLEPTCYKMCYNV